MISCKCYNFLRIWKIDLWYWKCCHQLGCFYNAIVTKNVYQKKTKHCYETLEIFSLGPKGLENTAPKQKKEKKDYWCTTKAKDQNKVLLKVVVTIELLPRTKSSTWLECLMAIEECFFCFCLTYKKGFTDLFEYNAVT